MFRQKGNIEIKKSSYEEMFLVKKDFKIKGFELKEGEELVKLNEIYDGKLTYVSLKNEDEEVLFVKKTNLNKLLLNENLGVK